MLAGLCGLLLATTLALQDTWFTAWHGAVPIHLLVAALVGVGISFDDWISRSARWAGAAILALAAALIAVGDADWFAESPGWAVMVYPPAVAAVLAAWGYLAGLRGLYAGAALSGALWTAAHSGRLYLQLRHQVVGLNQLAWGLLFFLLAALISLVKAGFWQRNLNPRPPDAPQRQ